MIGRSGPSFAGAAGHIHAGTARMFAHAMDRLVPFTELAQRLGFVAAPHAGGDDPGNAALCPHGIAKVIAAISAVGKHLTRVFGQCAGTCFPIIDIGRCDRHFLDQRCIGIGADMSLEAVDCPLSLMLYPARLIIVLNGRGNDGGIYQCSRS